MTKKELLHLLSDFDDEDEIFIYSPLPAKNPLYEIETVYEMETEAAWSLQHPKPSRCAFLYPKKQEHN